MEQLNALTDAYKLIMQARAYCSSGTMAVWSKLDHAGRYLDSQVKDLLSEPNTL